jgi:hypothetical protein
MPLAPDVLQLLFRSATQFLTFENDRATDYGAGRQQSHDARKSVVLPQPDSPKTLSVLPCANEKLTFLRTGAL